MIHRRQKFKPHNLPKKGHPLVRLLYEELNKRELRLFELAADSGICEGTIKEWKRRCNPNILNMEACLNVLGLTLTVTELKKEVSSPAATRDSYLPK